MGAVTLEKLLTHPRAFGIASASPVQRAFCRISDGLPLLDLAKDPNVVQACGGEGALALLPTVPPKEVFLVGAIRCGKSLIAAAKALEIALTIDLRKHLDVSEIARVSVVSLDVDKAKICMLHLMGALEREGGILGRYLLRTPKPTNERIVLRRDDGRRVEIVIAAGKKGGGSLVSRWTVAAIFDEAARMQGQDDGVVNFDEMRRGVITRLGVLPGAQLVVVTSPWAARGPVYDAVQDGFGTPSEYRVVMCATGPQLHPGLWTPEACEAERLRPDGAYETDVLGLFVDPEGGWLTATEVKNATRALGSEPVDEDSYPVGLEREPGVEYVAAMDPAVSGNAWTLVVAGKRPSPSGEDGKDSVFVALAKQWQGTSAEPLKARTIFGEMAPLLREYGLTDVYSDRWSGTLMAELGDYGGVTVSVSKDTPEQTAKHHANFRTLLLDERLELAPHPVLLADLLSKRKKLLPGGRVSYTAPVTRDGRHADFADAAVLAVARLGIGDGPGWVDAMKRLQRRNGVV